MNSTTKRRNGKSKRKSRVDEIRQRLDETTDNPYGQFKLLSRHMLNSKAFRELSQTRGGIIFLLAMLNELRYESKEYRDSKNVKRGKPETPPLLDEGIFRLTNDDLRARGLGSDSTIAAARRKAWELGFFDTLSPGSYLRTGLFRYSTRWMHYPDGPYKPVGQRPPGECLYPPRKRQKTKATAESVVTNTTENEAYTTESEAPDLTDQSSPRNESEDLAEAAILQKSKFFINYGEELRERSERAKSPSGAERAERYQCDDAKPHDPTPHNSFCGEGFWPDLDPTVLEYDRPARIEGNMAALGHECVVAKWAMGKTEILLEFENGASFRVRAKSTQYDSSDRKVSKNYIQFESVLKCLLRHEGNGASASPGDLT